jgi:hypothetical protein
LEVLQYIYILSRKVQETSSTNAPAIQWRKEEEHEAGDTTMSGSTSGAARMKRQGSIGMNDHASGSTGMSRRSSRSNLEDHSDRGLVMKDKERFEDEGSIGKAGGVGVGVTRPKRRLSR